jgi:hypothetical protein
VTINEQRERAREFALINTHDELISSILFQLLFNA